LPCPEKGWPPASAASAFFRISSMAWLSRAASCFVVGASDLSSGVGVFVTMLFLRTIALSRTLSLRASLMTSRERAAVALLPRPAGALTRSTE